MFGLGALLVFFLAGLAAREEVRRKVEAAGLQCPKTSLFGIFWTPVMGIQRMLFPSFCIAVGLAATKAVYPKRFGRKLRADEDRRLWDQVPEDQRTNPTIIGMWD